jgi:hypothetical protein
MTYCWEMLEWGISMMIAIRREGDKDMIHLLLRVTETAHPSIMVR